MLGNNPKRKPLFGSGDVLEIKNIFKTIQGEGPYAGNPAVFIRLGGCNLACTFCDTNFESYNSMQLGEIIEQVTYFTKDTMIKLIVITGGEPFRQPIKALCQKLIDNGYKVQIETNGTLYREIPEEVKIICSPKCNSKGYISVRRDLLARASAIKFLVSTKTKYHNKIVEMGQSEFNVPVFVQPMDEGNAQVNRKNTELAIQIAFEMGARLSLQLHKILEIE